MKIGDKIILSDSKSKKWTVQGVYKNFAILTRPKGKSYYYTIIDFDKRIRGASDRLFDFCDYMDTNDVKTRLRDLAGETDLKVEISIRNRIQLEDWIVL
ncbi:MAG: hypothetical protein ACRC1T_09540 [Clostridium chrysemydis]|uniref:hypothetical protein n=1 Tax=Clostridium chrysemydis TaxID=2665504 RepID=UPI003F343EA6